jgi:hypothetical protein
VAQNSFLDLIHLAEGTTGEAIVTQLLSTLNQLGLSTEVLKSHLLGFCTDGASNITGREKGALTLLAAKIDRQDILMFHCMNHRLELAVHDAVSATNTMLHLRSFMDCLYAYYSRSPKNVRAIEEASKVLGIECMKIGKIFDVRWLASSYVTVRAVLTSLPALVLQLQKASIDSTGNGKDRAKAQGMVNKLQSWSVLAEIVLTKDVLSVLKDFSLYLQSRSASIVDVKSRLDATVRTLAAMKSADNLALSDFNQQVATNGCYCGFVLKRTKNDEAQFTTMRKQFVQAIIDNVNSRFPDRQLLNAGAVLSPSSWPEEENELALFGDREVLQLASICRIDARQALYDFRQYKCNTNRIDAALSALLQRITLLPISSSECERGFSCMNINNTAQRNQLSIDSLASLIFIKVNGPRPNEFNAEPYVRKWLKEGRHASSDQSTGKSCKKNEQSSPWAILFE